MKRFIIGNMTGNSMDAIDLVLTCFDEDLMQDVCSYSKPYSADMQKKIENLRLKVFNKTAEEILQIAEFKTIHDDYVRQIADCINEMCQKYNLDKAKIDAIGFHGKTLDHNPPSKAKAEHTKPYTLQIGSGKMLADLTKISVVYDFRSDFLLNGFDGAPLVPPHNAHIAKIEGDGCYYNGGNTSNFAIIYGGKAILSADSGPCNEYIDSFIRRQTGESFDYNGKYGLQGKLNQTLIKYMFEICKEYYERALPKSGDPAYYNKEEIFNFALSHNMDFCDVIKTFEYFAAYIAAYALTLVPEDVYIPHKIILFGGGWKNPVVRNSLADILTGKGFVLPEHQAKFKKLVQRWQQPPMIVDSSFGDYMEARLFADLAYHKLEHKPWQTPETMLANKDIICGRVALPVESSRVYDDMLNLAAKGWQD